MPELKPFGTHSFRHLPASGLQADWSTHALPAQCCGIACRDSKYSRVFASPAAAADEPGMSPTGVAYALGGVSDLLAPLAAAAADGDSVADTGTADIRRDGTVHLRADGASDIVLTLPGAHTVAETANGGATYRNQHSATVTRPTTGGAQTLLVANSPAAPAEYTFSVAHGSVASLPGGGLLLLDANHKPVRAISPPWARDAAGNAVATKFTVSPSGTSFTQHVAHKTAGVQYPVVADPHFQRYSSGVVVTLSEFETGSLAATLIFLPVVSGLVSIGGLALGNKVLWRAGWYQAQAAWYALHDRCLWIWVPYIGAPDSGGYPC